MGFQGLTFQVSSKDYGLVRAEKYIYFEETQRTIANSVKNHGAIRSSWQTEEHPRKESCIPKFEKYRDYTPLIVSLVDLYKEVGKTERFLKPKALQVRANTNKSLSCEYHNGFGHRTKDCYDLRDAVE